MFQPKQTFFKSVIARVYTIHQQLHEKIGKNTYMYIHNCFFSRGYENRILNMQTTPINYLSTLHRILGTTEENTTFYAGPTTALNSMQFRSCRKTFSKVGIILNQRCTRTGSRKLEKLIFWKKINTKEYLILYIHDYKKIL